MKYSVNGRSKVWSAVGLFFTLVFLAVSFPVGWVGEFYDHLDQFSRNVRNYDRDESKAKLEEIKSDYLKFVSWKLQYPADRWLFKDMNLYEGALSVLNEDFEKAEKNDLKNPGNNYRVSYLIGIARFKVLHAAFQGAMAKKDKKQMDTVLALVLDEVRVDFEKCVEDGPGSLSNFNCSFNYDLTSDPNAAKKALANPKPRPKYILGFLKDKNKTGEEPDKKTPFRIDPRNEKNAGSGGAKKVG